MIGMGTSDEEAQVASWLEGEAERQRRAYLDETIARLREVVGMSAADYVRRVGLANLCPDHVPDSVKKYLKVDHRGSTSHFSVCADSGNEGIRLKVRRDGREWCDVVDPWP